LAGVPALDAAITFLEVADLERSDRFYAEDLGLSLVLDQGECRIYRLSGDAYLGMCERKDPAPSKVIVTLVTDDVTGWHTRLVDAGAEVDGPPRDNENYRIQQFFATDPDGHVLEVQRFWDEGWAAHRSNDR
jgi:predicted enzyme related to lactoylglutathione lyase